MPRILIMAGEASGDMQGARLAAALKSLDPGVELLGLGGRRMEAAGVSLIKGIERLDIIGLPGWAQLRAAVRTYRALAAFLRNTELDAVVFIDNPGLNLRLARVASKAGHRIVYYIAPQIWAWKAGRIRVIKRVVDLVLVILPFEERLYRDAGVPCRFVGHPLLDAPSSSGDASVIRREFGIEDMAKLVGLLPGSREREVHALLPTLLATAERLTRQGAAHGVSLRFLLAHAPSISKTELDAELAKCPARIDVVSDRSHDVMAAADLLLVASGTATLEAAYHGAPMVIVYRAGKLTAWVARRVIKTKWIGLVNLVAGKTVANEIIQEELTAERLSQEAERLLYDAAARTRMKAELQEVRTALGGPGASRKAAESILAQCKLPRRRTN